MSSDVKIIPRRVVSIRLGSAHLISRGKIGAELPRALVAVFVPVGEVPAVAIPVSHSLDELMGVDRSSCIAAGAAVGRGGTLEVATLGFGHKKKSIQESMIIKYLKIQVSYYYGPVHLRQRVRDLP